MAEAEIIALKEALYKQAQSIQELSAELEEERKAAASGADEALSMIFRLQEERAMEKMEASQYKRMTEAKLVHAEESLAFLREAMIEKEIEIATLKFQVECYRQNMLRVGINDSGIEETKMYEAPRLSRSKTFFKVAGSNDKFRRHISMPTSWLDNLNLDMAITDKNGPLIPTISSIWSETGECSKQLRGQRSEILPSNSVIEEVASYSESQEAKEDLFLKLNNEERVISPPVAVDDESQSNMRTNSFCIGNDSRNCDNLFKTKFGSIQINSKCNCCSCLSSQRHRSEHDSFSCPYLEKDSTREKIHAMNVQDIYEIPNSNYGGGADESCKSGSCRTTMEAKQKALEGTSAVDLSNRPPMKYPAIGKGVSMNSLRACEIAVCQNEFKELKQRVQKLENDQWIMNEEESKRSNEQLSLLKQIHEQLNMIQSQTKVSKRKQLSKQDEILLLSVSEAILSFAL